MKLNQNGRVVVCRTMSQSGPNPEAVTAHLHLASVHGRMESFIAYEYADRFESALKDLVGWYKVGQLRSFVRCSLRHLLVYALGAVYQKMSDQVVATAHKEDGA